MFFQNKVLWTANKQTTPFRSFTDLPLHREKPRTASTGLVPWATWTYEGWSHAVRLWVIGRFVKLWRKGTTGCLHPGKLTWIIPKNNGKGISFSRGHVNFLGVYMFFSFNFKMFLRFSDLFVFCFGSFCFCLFQFFWASRYFVGVW